MVYSGNCSTFMNSLPFSKTCLCEIVIDVLSLKWSNNSICQKLHIPSNVFIIKLGGASINQVQGHGYHISFSFKCANSAAICFG